jgi:hypothetical protein
MQNVLVVLSSRFRVVRVMMNLCTRINDDHFFTCIYLSLLNCQVRLIIHEHVIFLIYTMLFRKFTNTYEVPLPSTKYVCQNNSPEYHRTHSTTIKPFTGSSDLVITRAKLG